MRLKRAVVLLLVRSIILRRTRGARSYRLSAANRTLDIPVRMFVGYQQPVSNTEAMPIFRPMNLQAAFLHLRQQLQTERRIGYFPAIASMVLRIEAELSTQQSFGRISLGGLEREILDHGQLLRLNGFNYIYPDHFGVQEMALTWFLGVAPGGIASAPTIDYDDQSGPRIEYLIHDLAFHMQDLKKFLALPEASPARQSMRRLLLRLAEIQDDNELELQLFLLFYYTHEGDMFGSLVRFHRSRKFDYSFYDREALRELIRLMVREKALYGSTPLFIRPVLDQIRTNLTEAGRVKHPEPLARPIVDAVVRFENHFKAALGI